MFFKTYQTELTKWQRNIERNKPDFTKLSKGTYSKRIVGAGGSFPGFFYFFLYDPKHKATLPYYDRFPFVLVLDKGPNWFFGINFHYLSYEHRARFFDAMYPYAVNKKDDLKARMKVSYDILQATSKPAISKFFKPTLHKYLTKHVRTPLLQVGFEYWHLALFLPVHMFVKKSAQYIWKESAKQSLLAQHTEEAEEEGGEEGGE
jgi:hypothetical protein